MKQNVLIPMLAVSLCSILLFQNCAESGLETVKLKSSSGQQPTPAAPIQSAGIDNQTPSGQVTLPGSSNPTAPVSGASSCAPSTFTWTIGNASCSASTASLPHSTNPTLVSATLTDILGNTKGVSQVNCVNGVLQLLKGATCVDSTPTAPPVVAAGARLANGHSATYYLADGRVNAYTGATVSDNVAVCIQNRADSSYPCINLNGSTAAFKLVPRPPSPTSSTQELVWSSGSFYGIAGFDFGEYDIIFRKVEANGSLGGNLGSLQVSIQLEANVFGKYYGDYSQVYSGGVAKPSQFSSTAGTMTVDVICRLPNVRGNDFPVPAGFKAYPYFSDKECFYKVNP